MRSRRGQDARGGLAGIRFTPLCSPLPSEALARGPPACITALLPSSRMSKLLVRFGEVQTDGSNVCVVPVGPGETAVSVDVPQSLPESATPPTPDSPDRLVKIYVSTGKKWVLIPTAFIFFDSASLEVTLWPRCGVRPASSSRSSPPSSRAQSPEASHRPPIADTVASLTPQSAAVRAMARSSGALNASSAAAALAAAASSAFEPDVEPAGFYGDEASDASRRGTRVFILEPRLMAYLPLVRSTLKVKLAFQKQFGPPGVSIRMRRPTDELNSTGGPDMLSSAGQSSTGAPSRDKAAVVLNVNVLVSPDATSETPTHLAIMAAAALGSQTTMAQAVLAGAPLPFFTIPPDIMIGAQSVALSLDGAASWINLDGSFLVYDAASLSDTGFSPTASWTHESVVSTFSGDLLKHALFRYRTNPMVALGAPPPPVPVSTLRMRLLSEYLSSEATAAALVQASIKSAVSSPKAPDFPDRPTSSGGGPGGELSDVVVMHTRATSSMGTPTGQRSAAYVSLLSSALSSLASSSSSGRSSSSAAIGDVLPVCVIPSEGHSLFERPTSASSRRRGERLSLDSGGKESDETIGQTGHRGEPGSTARVGSGNARARLPRRVGSIGSGMGGTVDDGLEVEGMRSSSALRTLSRIGESPVPEAVDAATLAALVRMKHPALLSQGSSGAGALTIPDVALVVPPCSPGLRPIFISLDAGQTWVQLALPFLHYTDGALTDVTIEPACAPAVGSTTVAIRAPELKSLLPYLDIRVAFVSEDLLGSSAELRHQQLSRRATARVAKTAHAEALASTEMTSDQVLRHVHASLSPEFLSFWMSAAHQRTRGSGSSARHAGGVDSGASGGSHNGEAVFEDAIRTRVRTGGDEVTMIVPPHDIGLFYMRISIHSQPGITLPTPFLFFDDDMLKVSKLSFSPALGPIEGGIRIALHGELVPYFLPFMGRARLKFAWPSRGSHAVASISLTMRSNRSGDRNGDRSGDRNELPDSLAGQGAMPGIQLVSPSISEVDEDVDDSLLGSMSVEAVCVLPPGPPGLCMLSFALDGEAFVDVPSKIYYYDADGFSQLSFSPRSGPTSGGTPLKISVNSLAPLLDHIDVVVIKFDSGVTPPVVVKGEIRSGETITAFAPPLALGPHQVSFSLDSETWIPFERRFHAYEQPAVSISPQSASTAHYTHVVVTCSNDHFVSLGMVPVLLRFSSTTSVQPIEFEVRGLARTYLRALSTSQAAEAMIAVNEPHSEPCETSDGEMRESALSGLATSEVEHALRAVWRDAEPVLDFLIPPDIALPGEYYVSLSLNGRIYGHDDSDAPFRFYDPPIADNVAPPLVPASGGSHITVSGSQFPRQGKLLMGLVPLSDYFSWLEDSSSYDEVTLDQDEEMHLVHVLEGALAARRLDLATAHRSHAGAAAGRGMKSSLASDMGYASRDGPSRMPSPRHSLSPGDVRTMRGSASLASLSSASGVHPQYQRAFKASLLAVSPIQLRFHSDRELSGVVPALAPTTYAAFISYNGGETYHFCSRFLLHAYTEPVVAGVAPTNGPTMGLPDVRLQVADPAQLVALSRIDMSAARVALVPVDPTTGMCNPPSAPAGGGPRPGSRPTGGASSGAEAARAGPRRRTSNLDSNTADAWSMSGGAMASNAEKVVVPVHLFFETATGHRVAASQLESSLSDAMGQLTYLGQYFPPSNPDGSSTSGYGHGRTASRSGQSGYGGGQGGRGGPGASGTPVAGGDGQLPPRAFMPLEAALMHGLITYDMYTVERRAIDATRISLIDSLSGYFAFDVAASTSPIQYGVFLAVNGVDFAPRPVATVGGDKLGSLSSLGSFSSRHLSLEIPHPPLFTMLEPPVVDTISPEFLVNTGGTRVTISGRNLATATLFCKFVRQGGAGSDEEFVVQAEASPDGSEAVCITPHFRDVRPGSLLVLELSHNGQAYVPVPTSISHPFRVSVLPHVESLSPLAGPMEGGTTLLIKGHGLIHVANIAVRFTLGNRASTVMGEFKSSSAIACQTPPDLGAPGLARVSVALDGVNFSGNGVAFCFLPPPYIVRMYPSVGHVLPLVGEGDSPAPLPQPASERRTSEATLPSRPVSALRGTQRRQSISSYTVNDIDDLARLVAMPNAHETSTPRRGMLDVSEVHKRRTRSPSIVRPGQPRHVVVLSATAVCCGDFSHPLIRFRQDGATSGSMEKLALSKSRLQLALEDFETKRVMSANAQLETDSPLASHYDELFAESEADINTLLSREDLVRFQLPSALCRKPGLVFVDVSVDGGATYTSGGEFEIVAFPRLGLLSPWCGPAGASRVISFVGLGIDKMAYLRLVPLATRSALVELQASGQASGSSLSPTARLGLGMVEDEEDDLGVLGPFPLKVIGQLHVSTLLNVAAPALLAAYKPMAMSETGGASSSLLDTGSALDGANAKSVRDEAGALALLHKLQRLVENPKDVSLVTCKLTSFPGWRGHYELQVGLSSDGPFRALASDAELVDVLTAQYVDVDSPSGDDEASDVSPAPSQLSATASPKPATPQRASSAGDSGIGTFWLFDEASVLNGAVIEPQHGPLTGGINVAVVLTSNDSDNDDDDDGDGVGGGEVWSAVLARQAARMRVAPRYASLPPVVVLRSRDGQQVTTQAEFTMPHRIEFVMPRMADSGLVTVFVGLDGLDASQLPVGHFEVFEEPRVNKTVALGPVGMLHGTHLMPNFPLLAYRDWNEAETPEHRLGDSGLHLPLVRISASGGGGGGEESSNPVVVAAYGTTTSLAFHVPDAFLGDAVDHEQKVVLGLELSCDGGARFSNVGKLQIDPHIHDTVQMSVYIESISPMCGPTIGGTTVELLLEGTPGLAGILVAGSSGHEHSPTGATPGVPGQSVVVPASQKCRIKFSMVGEERVVEGVVEADNETPPSSSGRVRIRILCETPRFLAPGLAQVQVALVGTSFVESFSASFCFLPPSQVESISPPVIARTAASTILTLRGEGLVTGQLTPPAFMLVCGGNGEPLDGSEVEVVLPARLQVVLRNLVDSRRAIPLSLVGHTLAKTFLKSLYTSAADAVASAMSEGDMLVVRAKLDSAIPRELAVLGLESNATTVAEPLIVVNPDDEIEDDADAVAEAMRRNEIETVTPSSGPAAGGTRLTVRLRSTLFDVSSVFGSSAGTGFVSSFQHMPSGGSIDSVEANSVSGESDLSPAELSPPPRALHVAAPRAASSAHLYGSRENLDQADDEPLRGAIVAFLRRCKGCMAKSRSTTSTQAGLSCSCWCVTMSAQQVSTGVFEAVTPAMEHSQWGVLGLVSVLVAPLARLGSERRCVHPLVPHHAHLFEPVGTFWVYQVPRLASLRPCVASLASRTRVELQLPRPVIGPAEVVRGKCRVSIAFPGGRKLFLDADVVSSSTIAFELPSRAELSAMYPELNSALAAGLQRSDSRALLTSDGELQVRHQAALEVSVALNSEQMSEPVAAMLVHAELEVSHMVSLPKVLATKVGVGMLVGEYCGPVLPLSAVTDAMHHVEHHVDPRHESATSRTSKTMISVSMLRSAVLSSSLSSRDSRGSSHSPRSSKATPALRVSNCFVWLATPDSLPESAIETGVMREPPSEEVVPGYGFQSRIVFPLAKSVASAPKLHVFVSVDYGVEFKCVTQFSSNRVPLRRRGTRATIQFAADGPALPPTLYIRLESFNLVLGPLEVDVDAGEVSFHMPALRLDADMLADHDGGNEGDGLAASVSLASVAMAGGKGSGSGGNGALMVKGGRVASGTFRQRGRAGSVTSQVRMPDGSGMGSTGGPPSSLASLVSTPSLSEGGARGRRSHKLRTRIGLSIDGGTTFVKQGSAVSFTFFEEPMVDRVSPRLIPLDVSSQVSIYGTGLAPHAAASKRDGRGVLVRLLPKAKIGKLPASMERRRALVARESWATILPLADLTDGEAVFQLQPESLAVVRPGLFWLAFSYNTGIDWVIFTELVMLYDTGGGAANLFPSSGLIRGGRRLEVVPSHSLRLQPRADVSVFDVVVRFDVDRSMARAGQTSSSRVPLSVGGAEPVIVQGELEWVRRLEGEAAGDWVVVCRKVPPLFASIVHMMSALVTYSLDGGRVFGEASAVFNLFPTPTLDSIAPSNGFCTGGTTLTLRGGFPTSIDGAPRVQVRFTVRRILGESEEPIGIGGGEGSRSESGRDGDKSGESDDESSCDSVASGQLSGDTGGVTRVSADGRYEEMEVTVPASSVSGSTVVVSAPAVPWSSLSTAVLSLSFDGGASWVSYDEPALQFQFTGRPRVHGFSPSFGVSHQEHDIDLAVTGLTPVLDEMSSVVIALKPVADEGSGDEGEVKSGPAILVSTTVPELSELMAMRAPLARSMDALARVAASVFSKDVRQVLLLQRAACQAELEAKLAPRLADVQSISVRVPMLEAVGPYGVGIALNGTQFVYCETSAYHSFERIRITSISPSHVFASKPITLTLHGNFVDLGGARVSFSRVLPSGELAAPIVVPARLGEADASETAAAAAMMSMGRSTSRDTVLVATTPALPPSTEFVVEVSLADLPFTRQHRYVLKSMPIPRITEVVPAVLPEGFSDPIKLMGTNFGTAPIVELVFGPSNGRGSGAGGSESRRRRRGASGAGDSSRESRGGGGIVMAPLPSCDGEDEVQIKRAARVLSKTEIVAEAPPFSESHPALSLLLTFNRMQFVEAECEVLYFALRSLVPRAGSAAGESRLVLRGVFPAGGASAVATASGKVAVRFTQSMGGSWSKVVSAVFSRSGHELLCTTPTFDEAVRGPVMVEASYDGIHYTRSRLEFIVFDEPTFNSFSPVSLTPSKGAMLELATENVTDTGMLGVKFVDAVSKTEVHAATVLVKSSSTVLVSPPPYDPQQGDVAYSVELTLNKQDYIPCGSGELFRWVRVKAVFPLAAPLRGGTPLTFTGTNLTPDAEYSVAFHGANTLVNSVLTPLLHGAGVLIKSFSMAQLSRSFSRQSVVWSSNDETEADVSGALGSKSKSLSSSSSLLEEQMEEEEAMSGSGDGDDFESISLSSASSSSSSSGSQQADAYGPDDDFEDLGDDSFSLDDMSCGSESTAESEAPSAGSDAADTQCGSRCSSSASSATSSSSSSLCIQNEAMLPAAAKSVSSSADSMVSFQAQASMDVRSMMGVRTQSAAAAKSGKFGSMAGQAKRSKLESGMASSQLASQSEGAMAGFGEGYAVGATSLDSDDGVTSLAYHKRFELAVEPATGSGRHEHFVGSMKEPQRPGQSPLSRGGNSSSSKVMSMKRQRTEGLPPIKVRLGVAPPRDSGVLWLSSLFELGEIHWLETRAVDEVEYRVGVCSVTMLRSVEVVDASYEGWQPQSDDLVGYLTVVSPGQSAVSVLQMISLRSVMSFNSLLDAKAAIGSGEASGWMSSTMSPTISRHTSRARRESSVSAGDRQTLGRHLSGMTRERSTTEPTDLFDAAKLEAQLDSVFVPAEPLTREEASGLLLALGLVSERGMEESYRTFYAGHGVWPLDVNLISTFVNIFHRPVPIDDEHDDEGSSSEVGDGHDADHAADGGNGLSGSMVCISVAIESETVTVPASVEARRVVTGTVSSSVSAGDGAAGGGGGSEVDEASGVGDGSGVLSISMLGYLRQPHVHPNPHVGRGSGGGASGVASSKALGRKRKGGSGRTGGESAAKLGLNADVAGEAAADLPVLPISVRYTLSLVQASGSSAVRGKISIGASSAPSSLISHVDVTGHYNRDGKGVLFLTPSTTNSSTTFSDSRWEGIVPLANSGGDDGTGFGAQFELFEYGPTAGTETLQCRSPAFERSFDSVKAIVSRNGTALADALPFYLLSEPEAVTCSPAFGQIRGAGDLVLRWEPAPASLELVSLESYKAYREAKDRDDEAAAQGMAVEARSGGVLTAPAGGGSGDRRGSKAAAVVAKLLLAAPQVEIQVFVDSLPMPVREAAVTASGLIDTERVEQRYLDVMRLVYTYSGGWALDEVSGEWLLCAEIPRLEAGLAGSLAAQLSKAVGSPIAPLLLRVSLNDGLSYSNRLVPYTLVAPPRMHYAEPDASPIGGSEEIRLVGEFELEPSIEATTRPAVEFCNVATGETVVVRGSDVMRISPHVFKVVTPPMSTSGNVRVSLSYTGVQMRCEPPVHVTYWRNTAELKALRKKMRRERQAMRQARDRFLADAVHDSQLDEIVHAGLTSSASLSFSSQALHSLGKGRGGKAATVRSASELGALNLSVSSVSSAGSRSELVESRASQSSLARRRLRQSAGSGGGGRGGRTGLPPRSRLPKAQSVADDELSECSEAIVRSCDESESGRRSPSSSVSSLSPGSPIDGEPVGVVRSAVRRGDPRKAVTTSGVEERESPSEHSSPLPSSRSVSPEQDEEAGGAHSSSSGAESSSGDGLELLSDREVLARMGISLKDLEAEREADARREAELDEELKEIEARLEASRKEQDAFEASEQARLEALQAAMAEIARHEAEEMVQLKRSDAKAWQRRRSKLAKRERKRVKQLRLWQEQKKSRWAKERARLEAEAEMVRLKAAKSRKAKTQQLLIRRRKEWVVLARRLGPIASARVAKRHAALAAERSEAREAEAAARARARREHMARMAESRARTVVVHRARERAWDANEEHARAVVDAAHRREAELYQQVERIRPDGYYRAMATIARGARLEPVSRASAWASSAKVPERLAASEPLPSIQVAGPSSSQVFGDDPFGGSTSGGGGSGDDDDAVGGAQRALTHSDLMSSRPPSGPGRSRTSRWREHRRQQQSTPHRRRA
ncbi:uncharacterized protein AMSG_07181 [Thecamonas trahens ATCC 50062]|uniref:IPT/TIG domain-containing protein n=1 Tax=Thecamonas trahens ATCC 50062 TaxID=461836 RepID=A0A0L0DF14_THETB|nr:hypothetical protein AMSG_07181 [Thecamonas trahens ATCC 50062]KNC50932.1 hypothetical protein AMSG_07181 [Thecamonas trahens ATCC 50062]|eukprot:XP_013756630.1 hypothetical protein AMSG_07181 [Thecamonas trahens ATCC 50062]